MRFHRLIIPLVFGMLVIVPPQVYMERLTQGFDGNFFDFYPLIFKGEPYPKGNTSWHHLWFILYLFIYNVIAAPLFVWLITPQGKQTLHRLGRLANGKGIYLLALPGVIVYTCLSIPFPQTNDLIHDWSRLPYWFLFLLAGFVCIAYQPFVDSLERNRRFSLFVAFITFITINYFRWNDKEPWDTIVRWESNWKTYAFLALFPITAWFWVLSIIGYGKRYINKSHRALRYINEAELQ